MFDVNKIPNFTLEGAMVGFLILYTALQFADPIFIIFTFIADIILYLVMIAAAVLAAYIIAMMVYSIGETAYESITEWWQERQEPDFEWVELEELEGDK